MGARQIRLLWGRTAYIMPVTEARRGINTNSGLAVGIFRGATDSSIVIGGHIDSDSPENPGASDNASGAEEAGLVPVMHPFAIDLQ